MLNPLTTYTTRLLAAAFAICVHCLGSAPALAAGDLALNHIWSRLADIHGEPGSVESAEFSPDSRYIVTGTKFDFTVRLWRTVDGTQVWERTLPDEIERVAFTRDGRHVASVSEDFMLRVMRVADGETIFEFKHDNGIDGLAVSQDGRFLVTGQEHVDGIGPARVFDTNSWRIIQTLEHSGTVNEIDFSQDGRYMATVGDKSSRIWRIDDWTLVHEMRLDPERVFGDLHHIYINCKFSPDSKLLGVGGTHGFVYLLDVESGKLLRRFNKSGQKTETVAFTSDSRYLLVAGHGATIDFYQVEKLLDTKIENDAIPYAYRAPVTDALEYMDFNATGTLLTTAHQDGTVQLWTYMSDDPTINTVQHRKIRELQDEKAGEENRR